MHQLYRHIHLLLVKGLLLGLVVALSGILLASSDMGRWLEEEVGLSWLFKLRGPLTSPSEVVVVSIDHLSSQRLGLANNPLKWPRSLHADLVGKLSKHGARVIAFDIFFEEIRDPQENSLFAAALREANNTILFQSLNKQPVGITEQNGRNQQSGFIESITKPVPILSDAAFGLALFPLPKLPAQVNHFILFKPELGNLPTLPVASLLVYSLPVYELLHDLLNNVIPDQILQLPQNRAQIEQLGSIEKLSQSLRRLFLNNPGLAQQLLLQLNSDPHTVSPQQHQLLTTLIHSYDEPHSLYLNFYGPAQSIKTVSYYKVLESVDHGDPLELEGKAIFVGFSEQFQPQQKDEFYTVFSNELSGLDLSGVEIAATAFANLLQRRTILPSSAITDMLIYVIWGILLSIILRNLSAVMLFPAALLLGLAYHQLGYELFQQTNYWIPLAIPLLWQAPLALTGALLWNYFDAHYERRNIRHAFGQHLPIEVVDQLAKGTEHISANGEHLHGVVLSTDAQQYTRLSEQLNPVELRDLMNTYYQVLFNPIRNAGGSISDVVGDAALATWTSSSLPNLQQREKACLAALDILSGVEDFNQQHPAYQLPTRLGLHYGELVMGHVGAMDHYEYRAVGDTVNTASRIENLNKQLGTRILVSKEVLQGVNGFITRKLGNFLLQGKSKPLSLYELIAKDDQTKDIKPYADFDTALTTFQAQNWRDAANYFENFILSYGEDGPSQYYLNLSQQYIQQAPANWDGVIQIIHK